MTEKAMLDPQMIENLRAISPDDGGALIRELVGLFLQETPPRITDIETGFAKGDAPCLARAAHSIKGSASNFGASELSGLCAEIERNGRTGNLAAIPPLLARLQPEYARTKAALEALVGGS
ncbi:MAG: Hpt domain-containing protein [Opitutaceae bacterium]|nr:Hpt domain-containing protein [Opitutaceae bacterium]